MTNTNERPDTEKSIYKDISDEAVKKYFDATKEGGEWEKEFDEQNFAFVEIKGKGDIRDLMKSGLTIHKASDKPIKSFIRTLISRTRKEAEEKAWRKAVEAVPLQKLSPYSHRKRGMNKARQQLIQAAKESGVNLGV